VRHLDSARIVRWYMLALGTALSVEGGALLLVGLLPVALPVSAGDARHNAMHLVWGLAMLRVLWMFRERGSPAVAWTAVVFGVFYIVLGILGLLIDRPLGLLLGPGENTFHFSVGPLALGLGLWALASSSARSASRLTSAAGPGSASPAR
jgi:hypothetical protein